MATETLGIPDLSDAALLAEVSTAAASERHATARLIALLAELDARRLYLGEGYSSLFTYCTQALHLSEHAAYGRIEAARATRKCPILLDLLAQGAVSLTTVTLLAPHLTPENHEDVLRQARHKSKREVEQIVAALRPRADVPTMVRKLPERTATQPNESLSEGGPILTSSVAATNEAVPIFRSMRPAVIQPLSPQRYKLQVTIDAATQDKLRRVQDLIRHTVPSADVAVILDRALDLLLADLERQKHGASSRPRSAQPGAGESRHIPAAVRRAVWARDGARCAFTGTRGRCRETAFLEFHHVRPFAVGGPPSVDNVELRCRGHNQHEARLFFGDCSTVREEASTYHVDGTSEGAQAARSSCPHPTRSGPGSRSARAARPVEAAGAVDARAHSALETKEQVFHSYHRAILVILEENQKDGASSRPRFSAAQVREPKRHEARADIRLGLDRVPTARATRALWKLPAPWTRRPRPQRLGKPTSRFSTATTGPHPRHSWKTVECSMSR